jgi:hypothetical protein
MLKTCFIDDVDGYQIRGNECVRDFAFNAKSVAAMRSGKDENSPGEFNLILKGLSIAALFYISFTIKTSIINIAL